MWPAIYTALRFASYAALGYFVNDVGDAVSSVTGTTGRDENGKFKWWWILVILFGGAILIGLTLKFLIPKKYKS